MNSCTDPGQNISALQSFLASSQKGDPADRLLGLCPNLCFQSPMGINFFFSKQFSVLGNPIQGPLAFLGAMIKGCFVSYEDMAGRNVAYLESLGHNTGEFLAASGQFDAGANLISLADIPDGSHVTPNAPHSGGGGGHIEIG